MAKRSLLRQALERSRGAAPGSAPAAEMAPERTGREETPHAALADLFAALRRGEIPNGADGRPPDTARTDQLLAELDRAWRAPRAEAGSRG